MTCTQRLSLGAYALGTLDDAEQTELEAHLAGCADCRASLDEFDGLAGLLARVTPPAAPDRVVPTDDGLRRLLDAAAGRRRARRRRLLLAAAAAALVLVGGTAAGVTVWVRGEAPRTTSVAAAAGAVHARATVAAAATGSTVKLSLAGVPSGERCRLVAVAADGHREIASSWVATYAGTATVTGTVAIPRDQLVRLDVETFDGRSLVSLPLSG